jgi:hypothetical protein
VQEGHQDQVRGDLVIGRAAQERLAVTAPEGEEGVEQLRRVEGAVGIEPGRAEVRE